MQFKIQWYGNVMVEIYGMFKGLHDLNLGFGKLSCTFSGKQLVS